LESPSSRWERLADSETIRQTLEGLRSRGFSAELVENRKEALERVRSLIPQGARVMTGGTTQEQIGLMDLLASGNHPWVNMKGDILSEKNPDKQMELRRMGTFAQYFVGSVHAVAKTGELVAGSATGSQLAAYAYGAQNLILVVGAQKITQSLEDGLRRLREHSVPLEDRRMKSIGYPGTVLSKILIMERQTRPAAHVIIVNEMLGF
jgi:L-lactate utilization protein LutC